MSAARDDAAPAAPDGPGRDRPTANGDMAIGDAATGNGVGAPSGAASVGVAPSPDGGMAPPGPASADELAVPAEGGAASPSAAPSGAATDAPARGALRRPLLALVPLAVAAAGGAAFWAMLRGMEDGSYNPRGVPSALLGRSAPRTELPPVEGLGLPAIAPGTLAAPGRPVLVNFWASWCVPCVQEHPQLMALHRRGVPIYGLNHKDRPEAAAGFLARHGNPFAAVSADAGRVGIEWGVYGVPETYLLDAGGVIRWRWAGPVMPDTVVAELEPLLRRHA